MEQFIPRVRHEHFERNRIGHRFNADHSNVFDRLYQDSSIRQQNVNLADLSRRHFSAPREPRTSSIKIEDQLVYKQRQAQAKLNLLRAQKQAQELSELKSSPTIDPLSKELAENGFKYTVSRGKVLASPRNVPEPGEVFEFKVKLPVNQTQVSEDKQDLETQYYQVLTPEGRQVSSLKNGNRTVKLGQGYDQTLSTQHYTPTNLRLQDRSGHLTSNKPETRTIREKIADRISQDQRELSPDFQNLQSVQAMLSMKSSKSAVADRLASIRSSIESRLPPDRRPNSAKHKVNFHLQPGSPGNQQHNQTAPFKSEMTSLLTPQYSELPNISTEYVGDKSLEQIRKMFPLRNQLLEPEEPPDFLDMNVIDRNKLWMEIKDKKIQEKLEEKRKKEVEGCTFKPAIVPSKVASANSSSRLSVKLSVSPKRESRESTSYCEIYQFKKHMRSASQQSRYSSAGRLQKQILKTKPNTQLNRSESETKGIFYNQLSPANRVFRYRTGFSEDGPIRKNFHQQSHSDASTPSRSKN
jgi:hypothetical protein